MSKPKTLGNMRAYRKKVKGGFGKELDLSDSMGALTPREANFIRNYMETGNATEAVRRSYNVSTDASARSLGSKLLDKNRIQYYLQNMALNAVIRIEELAENAKNESVKLSANKDILDRAGYKPVERSVSLTKNLDKVYTQEQVEKAAREILKNSGVAYEAPEEPVL